MFGFGLKACLRLGFHGDQSDSFLEGSINLLSPAVVLGVDRGLGENKKKGFWHTSIRT